MRKIEEAFERKKLTYRVLVVEARQQGWQAHQRPVEIGARGFVAKSTTTFLLNLFFQGQSFKGTTKVLRLLRKRASGCGCGCD